MKFVSAITLLAAFGASANVQVVQPDCNTKGKSGCTGERTACKGDRGKNLKCRTKKLDCKVRGTKRDGAKKERWGCNEPQKCFPNANNNKWSQCATDAPSASPTSSPTSSPRLKIIALYENPDNIAVKRFSFSTAERASLFQNFRGNLCDVVQWRDGTVLRQVELLVFGCDGEETCRGRTRDSTEEDGFFQVDDEFSKGDNYAKVSVGDACPAATSL